MLIMIEIRLRGVGTIVNRSEILSGKLSLCTDGVQEVLIYSDGTFSHDSTPG